MSNQPSQRSRTALNWLNFFAADISDGVGPFLAVYLTSNLRWSPGQIGAAIAATTFSMVIGQGPAGYIIDHTRRKRLPLIIASVVVGTTALFLPALGGPLIILCQIIMGLAASFYMPSLVALTGVLSRNKSFDHTISRNQSYNHAGNVFSAVLTGIVARFTNNAGIFYCMMGMAMATSATALSIRQSDVDDAPTQNMNEVAQKRTKDLLREAGSNKPFLIFPAHGDLLFLKRSRAAFGGAGDYCIGT